MSARLWLWLILFGILCGSGDAIAETKDATEHASRARQLFSEQKFVEAAESLQRAYDADAKPLYLFNAGTAYRKAEKRREALGLYQRYLEVAPDGPLAAEARNYVKDLQALLAAQDNLQGTTQLLETERTQSQQKQEQLEQALRKERTKPIYKRPWFIVTATAVGIAVIATLGFAGYLQDKKHQAQILLRPTF